MNVRLIVLALTLSARFSIVGMNAAETNTIPGFEPVEAAFRDDLVQIEDAPGLPRVLLIGDSISIGYTRPVRARLAGRANVHRPPENCGATSYGLSRIDAWLGSGRWDVIHFNFGLHDLKYLDATGKYVSPQQGGRQVASVDEYAAHLRQLVRRMKATGAKLIFATTTPVPEGSTGRIAGNEQEYNAAARRVMSEEGVSIDDLHARAAAHPALQLPHNVHFTPAGSSMLADAVADSILAALPPPASRP